MNPAIAETSPPAPLQSELERGGKPSTLGPPGEADSQIYTVMCQPLRSLIPRLHVLIGAPDELAQGVFIHIGKLVDV